MPGGFLHQYWLSTDSPSLQIPPPPPTPLEPPGLRHGGRGGQLTLTATFPYSLGFCSCPGPVLLAKWPPSNPTTLLRIFFLKDEFGPAVAYKACMTPDWLRVQATARHILASNAESFLFLPPNHLSSLFSHPNPDPALQPLPPRPLPHRSVLYSWYSRGPSQRPTQSPQMHLLQGSIPSCVLLPLPPSQHSPNPAEDGGYFVFRLHPCIPISGTVLSLRQGAGEGLGEWPQSVNLPTLSCLSRFL